MAGIVLINTAAWKSPPFCDWYVKNIHPFWVNIYARIMGMFSFSVGEIMLAAGLAATASALFCGMIAAAAAVRHRGASYSAVGRDDALYASHPGISSQVSQDNVFLEKETWEEVEERAVIRTEIVDKVSDKFTETTMVFNGIEDGIRSYTRVVQLLLHYYDGSPELQQLLSSNPSPTSG